MKIYDEFCRKLSVVLLAFDVASRGPDFAVVNWVNQLDWPEDTSVKVWTTNCANAKFQKTKFEMDR